MFGYPVVTLNNDGIHTKNLPIVLSLLREKNVRLVYWFVDPENIILNRAAITNNGILADEKVFYEYDVDNIEPILSSERIKSALNSPATDTLRSLVFQSGVFSRFKIDTHFVNGEYEKLYSAWLEKSLSGEYADEVFVYELDGKEVGIITLQNKGTYTSIGLLAVDSQYRGQHIGSALLSQAIKTTKEMGCTKIEVVTQKKNTIACSFYEKNGFSLKRQENIYHFWL